MPDLSALPGDISIQPSLPGKNTSIAASDGTGEADAGTLTLLAGNDGLAAANAVMAGGEGTDTGSSGGNGSIKGGGSDTAAGAQVVAAGSQDGNGGDVLLAPGQVNSGGGRNGVIVLLGAGGEALPTSDPMVPNSIWSNLGILTVSAAT